MLFHDYANYECGAGSPVHIAFPKAVKGIEVVFQDERFTTVIAERVLMDAGVRREDRKKYVDKQAASIILQSYLDSQK